MKSELTGIVNGHLVDAKLSRGGDVTRDGVYWLAKSGVTKIICLKNAKQDSALDIENERIWSLEYRIEFVSAPLDSQGTFSYDDGAKVPAILDQITTHQGKVFVNCHHGSDRTGVVVACYRIQHGWGYERAMKEMKLYGHSWINFGMRHFVKKFSEQFKSVV